MTHTDFTLDEAIGDIVHDMRTPISAIKYNLELMGLAGDLNDQQAKSAGKATAAALRLETMVSRLLDVVWMQSEPEIALNEVSSEELITNVMETHETAAEQAQVKVTANIDKSVGVLHGDARLLERMLNNLVANAIKYNVPNGSVLIEAFGDQAVVTWRVRDKGRGISAEDLPHVFERFFRSQKTTFKIEGNGLGLSIVKAVVDRHHGTIEVDSEIGAGTVFTIRLPRHPDLVPLQPRLL